MAFSSSSSHWWLEGGSILHARLQDYSGSYVDSFIDLNLYIGNNDGDFVWGGRDYTLSGNSFSLDGSRLIGCLIAKDGSCSRRPGIELDDRIANNNGVLEYEDPWVLEC